jgi:DNA-3-methyladenine glycosylase
MACFSREFFARDTLSVARDVLGACLVRHLDGQRLSGIIVECEAYIGQDDTACHASHGRTRRNQVMFGPPGYAYVYFTYGMHWMLNIVTETAGFPAAVLLRALQPREGIQRMWELRRAKGRPHNERELSNGPARLTQALAIEGTLNGADLLAGREVWLEQGVTFADQDVECGPRIGIHTAAEKDQQVPWRFWVRDNPYVSR